MTEALTFTVNGREHTVDVPPARRLSRVLREDLGLTGTKVGCDAGDCGACTVLLNGDQVCACLLPAAQADGREIVTVEGLAGDDGTHSALQRAFARHGAAQCGICTPGMLMAAQDLLRRDPRPDRAAVEDAIGGVLCRCTGYLKIVEAVLDVGSNAPEADAPDAGMAVGARVARLDGAGKLDGGEIYGDDRTPDGALWLRVVRSPHALADFTLGDLDAWAAARPGVIAVLTARDVPGHNSFGIYPTLKDQPVFAERFARYRGEAVAAVVVETRAEFEALDLADFPIAWHQREAVVGIEAALKEGAPQLHDGAPGNVLIRGRVASGDVDAGLAAADAVVEAAMETGFVEHSYIEPEAGWARRVGDRVELRVTTQTPYMDRDEVAHVLGIPQEAVRVIPSAVGGGFGGKLDQSIQLPLAVAAWALGRPVAMLYHRPESFAATTKRHPARMTASLGVTRDGSITGFRFHGDFDTGAYASWGPTVAGRVPVHAPGPYRVGAVLATSAAVYTDGPPAGAFRGFGVPQAAIIGERLMDAAAAAIAMDPLDFRLRNALGAGDPTATGQVIEASVGLAACLEALKPAWARYGERVAAHNATGGATGGRTRLGAGIGCMWYGCGNTSMSNPSTMRLALTPDGRLTLFNGAVDIGQGSYTIMAQIAADALGAPLDRVDQVWGDTDLTPDAGKTSASRQTFVSGRAAELAGRDLRAKILRLANAGEDAKLIFADGRIEVRDAAGPRGLDLSSLSVDDDGHLLVGEGTFDPPTAPLDADGQGIPYATYAFAAQIALVEVDPELGTTMVRHMTAAHDVGRAVNPTLVEGQIHGGIAQGLGLALMEEYVPGRTENLHDYLIPTVGDMPEIDCILIEDPEPLGPFGAKGIGEPALVPTAPAILAGIRQAVGVCPDRLPVLPHRLRAAIRDARAREAAE